MVSARDDIKEKQRGKESESGILNPTFTFLAPFQMPSVPLAFASEEMGNEFSVIR